ncbi:MAG: hypothetical protein ACJAX3_002716 [Patiriisocius sp.]|jgi:hypothetical protein
MIEFWLYLNQGSLHIIDFQGLDHLCFIVSFCLLYSLKDWKYIIGLITAFTLGHCITLIISVLNIVTIKSSLVETLIPITILSSCANNYWCLFRKKQYKPSTVITYGILFSFGLIHGLGFSNFLKMMIFEEDSVILPLLGFNIGIEIAQLMIVFSFLIFTQKVKANSKYLRIMINTIIVLVILNLLLD